MKQLPSVSPPIPWIWIHVGDPLEIVDPCTEKKGGASSSRREGGGKRCKFQGQKKHMEINVDVSHSGWPRFGSVRLPYGGGTVRAIPVFGSGASSKEGFFCVSVQFNRGTVPVPVSVPEERF